MGQNDETMRMLGLIRESKNSNKRNKSLLREQSEIKDDIDLGEEDWFYSLDDTNGVYITADLLQLNQTTLEQIQKLVAYYDTWSDEWATKIAEEYNNEVADEENAEEGPESIETEEIEGETGEEFGTEEGF